MSTQNKAMLEAKLILGEELHGVITKYAVEKGKLVARDRKITTLTLDVLVAMGKTYTDFISPKKKESTAVPEVYAAMAASIKGTFNKTILAMLDCDVKTMPEGPVEIINNTKKYLGTPEDNYMTHCKGNRYYWQAQIGSRLNDLRDGLKTREARAAKAEEKASGKDKEKEPNSAKPRSTDQRVRDKLNEALKICEKSEDAGFDITEMVKAVKAALKLIK